MSWVDQSKWVILTCLLISGKVLAQDPVEAIPRDDAKFLIDEHHKAQAHVDKALSSGVDLSALMCTPPSQVAFVEKSKHIKIPDSLDPTDQNLDRYRAAGVPIFDSCQIWISDKWEFIFLLQPKSSAKMVMRAVRKDICKKAACLEEEFRLLDMSEFQSIAGKLATYFVFTFVRNPWTRALSTYSMFHRQFFYLHPENPEDPPQERCGVPFDEFSRDVGVLFDTCERDGCCSYVAARSAWWPEFVNIHIGDQSHCVFLPNGEPLVDYIGLTEYFDAAWVDIMTNLLMRHNGTRRLMDADEEVLGEPHRLGGVIREDAAEWGAKQAEAAPAPAEGQVTIWHAVPQDGNGTAGEPGPKQGVAYVTQAALADEVQHQCNSTRTMQFFNQTNVRDLARQYALDVVRLGYL